MMSADMWNDIEEKLPKTTGHSQDYLVVKADGDMVVAAWMNIGGWDFEPESPITHWMELPEAP